MAVRTPSVVAAVKRDIAEIAKRDASLATSSLAATAQKLARELDKVDNSATSKSMCSRELRETMSSLREMAPPKGDADRVTEISQSAAARRADPGAADAPAKPRSRARHKPRTRSS